MYFYKISLYSNYNNQSIDTTIKYSSRIDLQDCLTRSLSTHLGTLLLLLDSNLVLSVGLYIQEEYQKIPRLITTWNVKWEIKIDNELSFYGIFQTRKSRLSLRDLLCPSPRSPRSHKQQAFKHHTCAKILNGDIIPTLKITLCPENKKTHFKEAMILTQHRPIQNLTSHSRSLCPASTLSISDEGIICHKPAIRYDDKHKIDINPTHANISCEDFSLNELSNIYI